MPYFLVVAVVFAVVASIAARSRGRNALGWFLAGLVIGPFALLVTMLPVRPCLGQFKSCSSCGEIIREDASVCRFCKRDLPAAH